MWCELSLIYLEQHVTFNKDAEDTNNNNHNKIIKNKTFYLYIYFAVILRQWFLMLKTSKDE